MDSSQLIMWSNWELSEMRLKIIIRPVAWSLPHGRLRRIQSSVIAMLQRLKRMTSFQPRKEQRCFQIQTQSPLILSPLLLRKGLNLNGQLATMRRLRILITVWREVLEESRSPSLFYSAIKEMFYILGPHQVTIEEKAGKVLMLGKPWIGMEKLFQPPCYWYREVFYPVWWERSWSYCGVHVYY